MPQAVLDGVRDLLPALRERADDAERARVVPEASVKELEETGFFRMLQPTRYDGLEADPIDFFTCVRDIAGACGSTGWIASVLGVHPWQVALFAEEAQSGGRVSAARRLVGGRCRLRRHAVPTLLSVMVVPARRVVAGRRPGTRAFGRLVRGRRGRARRS